MSLITPDFGLFFWMLLAFGVVFFLLRKFAWGPIMQGLQSRESSISEALSKAEQAHGEVLRMQEQSKALEAEGRAARVKMISEAERLREQMMREAREQAQAEKDEMQAKIDAYIAEHGGKSANDATDADDSAVPAAAADKTDGKK